MTNTEHTTSGSNEEELNSRRSNLEHYHSSVLDLRLCVFF